MMEATLTLPDEVVEKAAILAGRSGEKVTEVMERFLESALGPIGTLSSQRKPWSECSDEEVLAAWNVQLPEADDRRLSDLLDRQQAGEITSDESPELAGLLSRYQDGLLLKAQALREAVRRGLLSPSEV